MPVVNALARELLIKVVYYGPGLGGKTSSLRWLHDAAAPEHRGKMVSLATPTDRTLYFDYAPLRFAPVHGMSVKLQLFTVPGQVHFNETRRLLLTGADAVIFVADSQRARHDANLESLDNLEVNLAEQGHRLSELPFVLQFNKRDLPDILELSEMEQQYNRVGAASFATSATTGEGLAEALDNAVRQVLDRYKERGASSDGFHFEAPEGGLAQVLRESRRPAALLPSQPGSVHGAGGPAWADEVPTIRPAARFGADSSAEVELERWDVTLPPGGVASEPSGAGHEEVAAPSPVEPAGSEESVGAALRWGRAASESVVAVGFTLVSLWPSADEPAARAVERALAEGESRDALLGIEALITRSLARAGALLGGKGTEMRDPATTALLLGVDRGEYLAYRSALREVRQGRVASLRSACAAYLLACDLVRRCVVASE